MSDYAFVHDGRAFTPNQTSVDVAAVDAHNTAIEDAELAAWAAKPLRMLAYYSFPAEHAQPNKVYRSSFDPLLGVWGDKWATVSTWRGKELGTITSARVYRHNFGARMVSMRVRGSNGATYYGRASWDNGSCIWLRRTK